MGLDPLLGTTALTPLPIVTDLDDGGVAIDFGAPPGSRADDGGEHYGNLAEQLSEQDLDYIAEQLLRDIDDDNTSRADWIILKTKAMDLLGLRIEEASTGGTGAITRSTVRSPILLDACVRYQAETYGEMLPAEGPAKVMVPGGGTGQEREEADTVEDYINHYLVTTATEYYPDFDQMLFHQGFAGCVFRKIYRDPLRGRPVAATVFGEDLIVSQDVVDIENASRLTHQIEMRQSVMKRMQLLGVYRDIALETPQPDPDQVREKAREIAGISPSLQALEKKPHQVYECYTELDLPGYQHMRGEGDGTEPSGLPLPYQITIEKTSRKILAIRRNWREGDDRFRAVQRFVKYPFIRALGFYDVGLAHLLSNSARTLTAIWRMLIDAGTFANFPGWIFKKGAKFSSTNFIVGPGEGKEVDIGDAETLDDAIKPLPYKDPSPVLAQFAAAIEEGARKLGSNADLQIGEGRQDAPVGTTIALLDRAVKIMTRVHKVTCQAHGVELRLLQELFAEDPTPLLYGNETPEQIAMLKAGLSNRKIVPASDPNVPSHMLRIMQCVALIQMATQAPPGTFNMDEIFRRCLKTLGFTDVDEILIPAAKRQQQPGQAQPDPKVVAAQIKAQETQARGQQQQASLAAGLQDKQMQAAHDVRENAQQAADRISREGIVRMNNIAAWFKQQHDAELADKHNATELQLAEAKRLEAIEHTRQAEIKLEATKVAAKKTSRAGFADGGRVAVEIEDDDGIIVELPEV